MMTEAEILEEIWKIDEPVRLVGLQKRGLWYRPNAHGYTYLESEAWRLTPEEAKKHEYLHDEPVTIRQFNPKPYTTSRDAIIPVIEKQTITIKDIVSGILFELQTRGEHQFLATAKQLCIALLKAKKRWRE